MFPREKDIFIPIRDRRERRKYVHGPFRDKFLAAGDVPDAFMELPEQGGDVPKSLREGFLATN